MSETHYYISITGLKLNRFWHIFRFFRYAVPALRQARQADGNLRTRTRNVDGVRHTLTVWQSEEKMRAFAFTDPHLSAIEAFPSFASGKTYGYRASEIPDWDEALDLWRRHGVEY